MRIALMLAACLAASAARAGSAVPDGFVWLSEMVPTIEQDIRYYGAHNFLGRPVAGYEAPECILTRAAAEALLAVQAELAQSRLSLKVYDCYRPQRAVDDFVAWAAVPEDTATREAFYPRVDKADLFDLGYVAKKSGHSRGSTVDLAVVPIGHPPEPAYAPGDPLADCALPADRRFADASLDFGTGYDCMDPKSHHGDGEVAPVARANRLMLKDVMERHGFVPYPEEWWHYTLAEEPFPDTYFDFPVTARAAAEAEQAPAAGGAIPPPRPRPGRPRGAAWRAARHRRRSSSR